MEAWNFGSRSTQTLDKMCCFFPQCDGLVEHLPVCGWLHVAANTIKGRASIVTKGWDDETTDTLVGRTVMETIAKVKKSDPARGDWCVQGKEINVWVDDSS